MTRAAQTGSTRMQRSHIAAAIATAVATFAGAASTAEANTLRYTIGGAPMVIVNDGAAGDLSLAPDIVRVNINTVLVWGGATVRVTGQITATDTSPGTGVPSVVINAMQVTNMAGNLMAMPIRIDHQFAATSRTTATARIAGRFNSSLNPGLLGGGSLAYSARVQSQNLTWKTVASGFTGALLGAAPIPFAIAGGPVGTKQGVLERQDLTIYLDQPGDYMLITAVDNSRFQIAWLAPAAIFARRNRRTAE